MSSVYVKCDSCKEVFSARVADRNRGWGKYCSKSCKAKKQAKKFGSKKSYREYFFDWEEDRHPFDIDQ